LSQPTFLHRGFLRFGLFSLLLLLDMSTSIMTVGAQQSALRCYQTAREKTLLSKQDALRLCQNSDSLGPVACYESVTEEALLDNQKAVRLCRCAASTEPADCFIRARQSTTLSELEMIDLCSRHIAGNIAVGCDRTQAQDER